MKVILFIIILLSISCKKNIPIQVNNEKEYSQKEIRLFKEKIKKYSLEFTQDAKKYGKKITPPHIKYKFSVLDWKDSRLAHYFVGTIYLKKDFTKLTFYHELGHAEFDYAHDFNHKENNLENNTNDFFPASIMAWNPAKKVEKALIRNWEHYVKHFFQSNTFSKLNTVDGLLEHLKMQRRNSLYLFVETPSKENYIGFLNIREVMERQYFLAYRFNYEYSLEGSMIRSYERYILTKYGNKDILKEDINYEYASIQLLEEKYLSEYKRYNAGSLVVKK